MTTTSPAARLNRGYVKPLAAAPLPDKGRGRPVPVESGDVQLTTGAVAALAGVATRTVAGWCDRGELRGWRVPGSRDRRVLAADLLAFLEAAGAHVQPRLRAMVRGRPELVLYRCPERVVAPLRGLGEAADLRAVESAWALAQLFARPNKAGVLVCGDGAARSEIADVFAHVPPRWLRVHVRGVDQEAADGADAAFAGGEVSALLAAVVGHLLTLGGGA